MTPTSPASVRSWRQWSCDEWSHQLVDFFFVREPGSEEKDDDSVTALAVTPEDLRDATRDVDADPLEVRDAFVSAVQRQLQKTHRSLCADANDRGGWTPCVTHERPHFVSHLTLACLAASECSEELVDERGFQARLNALAGNHVGNHDPKCLPVLWELLVQWLENCRGRGEPLRELVLPEPGGLSRIGHTVRLAFPSRRDQRLLVELLDESGLRGLEPPLVATVRAIEGRFREFSDRFQAEYRDFQERLSRGVRGVASSPVWRAVRDASLRGASGIRRTRQRFSLVCGPEDPLWMLVVLEAPTALKDEGWAARSMPSEQYAGWSHYLAASDAETEQEGADEAVAALFAGDLAAPPLGRVLEQGVLLFGERSGGIYELESSPPKGGSMLALVRNNARLAAGIARELGSLPAS